MIKVNHGLVKKKKNQFVEFENDVKAILGMNGVIWVYYSTVKVENEYFTDDKTKINSLDKDEDINANSTRMIILFKNIIAALDERMIEIIHSNIMQYYKLYQKITDTLTLTAEDKQKGKEVDKDIMQSAFISKEINEQIIKEMEDELKKKKNKEEESKEAQKVIQKINSSYMKDD